jgi:predicted heme/steroid binding protein
LTNSGRMSEMERTITKEELRTHDGTKAPAWVAIDGIVYDISESFLWIHGKHQDRHWSGIDLTGELRDAPHDESVLERFPKVGRLQD